MDEAYRVLAAGPTATNWELLTRLAEELTATEVDTLGGSLGGWPARIRAMPDHWWRQRLGGDNRPYHALATHHRPVLDGFVELEWSGGCTIACSAEGRTVLLSGGFEPHHRGGDIFAWDTADRTRRTLLSGKDYHGVTAVAAFTPDGTVVAIPMEEILFGQLTAWGSDGPQPHAGGDDRPRWRRPLGEPIFDEDGETLEEFVDAELELVGLAVSGDGGVVAAAASRAGTVLAVDLDGAPLAEFADTVTGAVTLDRTGDLLAYAVADGSVVVRDLRLDREVLRVSCDFTHIDALAVAPDGSALCAAGRDGTGLAAAQIWQFDGGHVIGSRPVRPALPELPTVMWTESRVCWGVDGPLVFATGGRQYQPRNNPGSIAMVFDSTGQVRWSEPGHHLGAFSQDGKLLVTASVDGDNNITVWFLDRPPAAESP